MTQLVVSTNRYEYANFKCIQSLQNLEWENVSVLIFNSTKDSEVDTILELSKALELSKEGSAVEKIIYINQQINSLYYGLFAGAQADIYNDETMLNDEETLEYLVSDYKNTGMTIKPPKQDVETISKFVATVSKESADSLAKLIKNAVWLQTLQNSVENVETALVRTDDANVGMVEMFNKTSEIIETLQEGQTRTTEEIEKLSKYLEEVEQSSTIKPMNLFDFPTFQVPNTISKVLYIRVFSPCKYLFSFIEAYQHYLKMNKQINSKFLIAVPKLKQFIKKYENLTRLAPETINQRGIQSQELFVTHEPKSQILSAFFNMKADMFIVIDMMFGNALLAGAKVVQFGAVTGLSDIQRYSVDPKRCIISGLGLGSNIIIPSIPNYGYMSAAGRTRVAANITNKRTKYFEACKDKGYKHLDLTLGV